MVKYRGRKIDDQLVCGALDGASIVDASGHRHAVNADTLERFCGKDADGNDVYEGDTVVTPGGVEVKVAASEWGFVSCRLKKRTPTITEFDVYKAGNTYEIKYTVKDDDWTSPSVSWERADKLCRAVADALNLEVGRRA